MKSEVKSVKSVSRRRLVGKRTLPTSGSRQAILPVKSETDNETDLETLLDRGAEWRNICTILYSMQRGTLSARADLVPSLR